MRRHHSHFSLLLLCLLLAVSCNDTANENPIPAPAEPFVRLEINGSAEVTSSTFDVGDTAYISVTAAADAYLKTFAGYRSIGNEDEILFQQIIDTTLAEVSMDSLTFIFDFSYAGKEVSYLFVVTDQLDQGDSATVTVSINESPIIERTGVVLAPYNHPDKANFYNILSDTAYFPANLKTSTKNQNGVDLILSYDRESKFTFSAPDDPNASATWTTYVKTSQWPFQTPNSTRFTILEDAFDFDAIVTAAQLVDIDLGAQNSLVSTLTEGQVIAFELDGSRERGKVGILRIADLAGNAESNRSVTLDLKIPK